MVAEHTGDLEAARRYRPGSIAWWISSCGGIGDLSKVKTWKLPYLLTDGEVDSKRLPKAIQCILTDYRDKKVAGIPEEAIPAVLTRLAEAASRMGRMPPQTPNPAEVYKQLATAMEQIQRNRPPSGE